MSNQDQLNYRLGSVNIGLDRLILVWIGLHWFGSINIGHYFYYLLLWEVSTNLKIKRFPLMKLRYTI